MKNSPDRDLTFYNDWSDEPLHSILITGPNGSGKTTLLRVVSGLWEAFGLWLANRTTMASRFLSSQGNLFRDIDLVAVEIRDLPDFKDDPVKKHTLWLYIARSPEERDKEFKNIEDSQQRVFIGEVRSRGEARGRLDIRGRDRQWFEVLAKNLERLSLGIAGDLVPNMIYLDAENRQISSFDKSDAAKERKVAGEFFYEWLVRYRSSRDETHLETKLRYLALRDLNKFTSMVQSINLFFGGEKYLTTDFDSNVRLRVQIGNSPIGNPKNYHYIEDLSSGEKQCLLLVFMVTRWLMPGGIVLIDEPDLHLHVSLQRQLIATLEQIVKAQNGQMIVTSHSPTVWEEYNESQWISLKDEEWQITSQETDGNN